MSGGIAYVYDADGNFGSRCNREMIDLEDLGDAEDARELRTLLEKHVAATGSALGRRILSGWEGSLKRFVKVMPRDFKRMRESIRKVREEGLSGEAALMAAFQANNRDISRVSGN